MRTIPSPHGGLLHHRRHEHEVARHDSCNRRRHHHGERFGRGRNSLPASAFGREDLPEIAQVAQQIRAATRSLLHHGTPEQLAEGQRLLEDTRRTIYLILAGEPETTGPEPSALETDDTAETNPAPEIG